MPATTKALDYPPSAVITPSRSLSLSLVTAAYAAEALTTPPESSPLSLPLPEVMETVDGVSFWHDAGILVGLISLVVLLSRVSWFRQFL